MMARMARDLPLEFGREVRAARLRMRRSQAKIAAAAGVSQPLISKMELGRGGGVPLATWSTVAGVLGLQLELVPLMDGRAGPWQRLIVETARSGDWTASSTGDETLLSRGDDRVVVHAWDVVTVVTADADRLMAAMAREGEAGGRVSGIVVIPGTGDNRRRVSELRAELRDAFPARANAWYAALVNPHRPMPAAPGILWAFPDGTRLRPASLLPGWIWTAVGDGPRFATGRRRWR
jgi:hypothetical protein